MQGGKEKIKSETPVRQYGEVAEASAIGLGITMAPLPAEDEEGNEEGIERLGGEKECQLVSGFGWRQSTHDETAQDPQAPRIHQP